MSYPPHDEMNAEKDITGWTGAPQTTRKRPVAIALGAAAFALGTTRAT